VKLLLDTHIWLWSLRDQKRLSRRAARELGSPRNEIWLSPISIWETVNLLELGRLKVKGDPLRWLDQVLAATVFREASFTRDVATRAAEVHLPYRDPADRLLVASALVYDLTLVTADQRLLDKAPCTMLRER
jgi:PIN domain nuclease of toxin-antitoxin system